MNKLIICLFAIFLTACAVPPQQIMPAPAPYTNTPGMSDRQAILNVVTAEVRRRHHVDANLSIHYLKIYKNWAYIETTGGGDPGVNAVLRKVQGHWMLAKATKPCAPACPNGMTTCADGELICKNTLHQQFPNAPVSIFPSANARRMVINS